MLLNTLPTSSPLVYNNYYLPSADEDPWVKLLAEYHPEDSGKARIWT